MRLAPGVFVAEGVLRYTFSSSQGPGGQNVNRRATKAELRVTVADLPLPPAVRNRLVKLAGARITTGGELVIISDEHRSQARNKAECLTRLRNLIVRAKVTPKRRVPTKPTRGSIRRRLDEKRRKGEAKRRRRPPDDSG